MKDRKRLWKIAGITLGAVVLVVGLMAGAYMLWERAPAVQPVPTAVAAASPLKSRRPTDIGAALVRVRESL